MSLLFPSSPASCSSFPLCILLLRFVFDCCFHVSLFSMLFFLSFRPFFLSLFCSAVTLATMLLSYIFVLDRYRQTLLMLQVAVRELGGEGSPGFRHAVKNSLLLVCSAVSVPPVQSDKPLQSTSCRSLRDGSQADE